MTVLIVGDVIDDILVRALEPVTEDSDTRSEIIRRPGGSTANQAAWLGHLGTPVAFVGRVAAAGRIPRLDRWRRCRIPQSGRGALSHRGRRPGGGGRRAHRALPGRRGDPRGGRCRGGHGLYRSGVVAGAGRRRARPTGGGDAFCAGFLHHWLAGADVRSAATAGMAVAARAVGQVGARPG